MSDNLNIVFLSRTIPEKFKDEVYKNQINSMPSAAVAFQKKLIDGIEENIKHPVSMFNLMPVYSFPQHYREMKISPAVFFHTECANDYNAGFCNIAYLKRLLLPRTYLRQFKRYMKRNPECNAVVCYTADMILLRAVKHIKKKRPYIKTCLIVPDMPEYNDLSTGQAIHRVLYNKHLAAQTHKMKKHVDCFVYLTDQSAEYFCGNKPYTVVEGIASIPKDEQIPDSDNNNKTILYTGTTNARFGILTLLEAFSMIKNPDYRLVICGCGDSDEKIKKASEKDNRIQFMGVVPHEKIEEIQRKATVLVNPRQNIGEYTKYSFPSKNMEYLVSGVPLIAYKLDGIPDEYDSYINYVADNSAQSLCDTIMSVCQWDENKRREFGQKARAFVVKNKNACVQTKKIIDLINNL